MRDIDKIRKALVDQGWRIQDRKGGHAMAYPPDKSKPAVTLPGSPSGSRWMPNLIALLRRSGFVWPPPKR
ncbi:MAG: hypothetical protein ACRDYU_03880 [Actinomycetes bacterium]